MNKAASLDLAGGAKEVACFKETESTASIVNVDFGSFYVSPLNAHF